MTYNLQADNLAIKVNSKGAELQSVVNKNGQELLWQGDAKYWEGRSPILFPVPGSSLGGCLRIDGAEYPMPHHGFACHMEFQLVQRGENSITLALTHTQDTLEVYPYEFRLEVSYTIVGSSLNVGWRVDNCSGGEMHFMIGAHPGFNLPRFNPNDDIHGYLFTPDATDMKSHVVLPDGLCHPEVDTVVLEDGILPLTNGTFDCDTILDQTGRFHQFTLMGPDKSPVVRLSFNAPVLAIWAPCGGCAPFVCIEPWHGICDDFDRPCALKDRNHVIHLSPEGTWQNTYTITAL